MPDFDDLFKNMVLSLILYLQYQQATPTDATQVLFVMVTFLVVSFALGLFARWTK